jgi:Bacterial surface proteins containing Ig-like domains
MNVFSPKTRFGAVCCALSLLVSSITACGPKEEPITPSTPGGDTTVPVSGVSISATSLTIDLGKTGFLSAKVSPSNATDKTITWSSSNTSVATVSDGTVTAVAVGEATITASAGGKSATCLVTVKADGESAVKAALMKIYNAMDGVHWTLGNKWDVSKPLNDWECVEWDSSKKELKLTFGGVGLKGEFPDCFDELTSLTWLLIQNEPGVTGTLPASFGKLKNLKWMILNTTSMTSLPDFFKDIPFTFVSLNGNEKMAGPLPASLPGSNPTSVEVQLWGNAFTGTVPDSWASLGTRLKIENETHLDERVPDSFLTAADASYLINMYLELSSWRETPIVVGDYDIPAFWPKRGLKDIVTGKSIPYKEICAKNKVTILLNWGTWCPFSKEIMPILKQMYEKYHKDGLEIIAAFNASSDTSDEGRPLKDVLLERGYDQWYNFNIWDLSTTEWSIWCAGTPSATLVDKDGNTIASGKTNVSDPLRNRFGYTASTTLIPTLESIFGPVEGDDGYESTDYSQDGQVVTIQTAATGKGINLVFMGDAYTDKDIASGLYMEMMREAANQFFSIEPYKTFKNRFNVYAVKVVSKNGKTGAGYTTALGTQFVNGSAATGNEDKIYNYALKVPGISDKKNLTIGVLVNTIYHGGIASMSESLQSGIGYYASNGNLPYVFGNTIRHEVGGHAFAFLADEYATSHGAIPQAEMDVYNRRYKDYGWYANVDFTNDTKKIKWADFLSDSRYKDKVGVFEGGATYAKGVYKPSESSMMNENMDYFNAPSRWAIYQRIMKLSGESCTFSKFLEYDTVNRSQPHPAPRPSNFVERVPEAPPVVRP